MKFYFNQTILFADLETIRKVPIFRYDKRTKIFCKQFDAISLVKLKLVFDYHFSNPTYH